MNTATATQPNPSGFFEEFKSTGYGLKPAIIGTLFTGIYLHLSVVFLGHALVMKHIVTPLFDMLLAIPITYGAIVSWIAWKRVIHPSAAHRFLYGVLAVYFTISIPFHVRTYLIGNTDLFLAFPVWYSAVLLPFLVALIVFTWRLQFKPTR